MGTAAAVPGSRASAGNSIGRDERFFFISAIVMAVVLVAGFSTQLALGRSTFASPARIHLHAFIFFAWVVLYVAQNSLAATGSLKLHRKLGWLATAWIPLMVVSGTWVTLAKVQAGAAPPFFQPAYFLIMNPLQIGTFAGLAAAAIVQRRNTQWHRRLMFCAMAEILGPGFGRLLPMPLLIPWTGLAAWIPGVLFIIAGMVRDWRKGGKVHAAWWWGLGVAVAAQLLIEVLPSSPAGLAIHAAVTAGHPGAALPPLEFPLLAGR